jgi:hypothetical protein
MDVMDEASPLVPIEPSHARKLLRELVRWSASFGFQPHPDFAKVEQLFGKVDAQSCDAEFQFGMNGKPFLMSGPTESSSASRVGIAQLSEQLGSDGFEYVVLE